MSSRMNMIVQASTAPSTWPLAVRLLVITSSTVQNFETNPRIGADAEVTMMTFLLLVTWLAFGQPPSHYQIPFSSNEACEAARLQLIKDAERIGQSMGNRWKTGKRAGTPFGWRSWLAKREHRAGTA